MIAKPNTGTDRTEIYPNGLLLTLRLPQNINLQNLDANTPFYITQTKKGTRWAPFFAFVIYLNRLTADDDLTVVGLAIGGYKL